VSENFLNMFNARGISLILSVFVMSFFVGYFVLSWTEPAQAPPDGNVDAPITKGSSFDTKTGGILLNSLFAQTLTAYTNLDVGGYIYNKEEDTLSLNDNVEISGDNDLTVTGNSIVSGTGTSSFAGKVGVGTLSVGSEQLKIQGDVLITGGLTVAGSPGKGTFSSLILTPGSAPASPTEGQIYWNGTTHKLYVFDGTSWKEVTSSTQAYCQSYPSGDTNCGIIDCSSYYVQTGTEGVNSTEYCYNKADIASSGSNCKAIDYCKDPNTSDTCTSQSEDALQYQCGSCKYITAGNCSGNTLGTCTNYADSTACTAVSGGSCLSGGCYKIVAVTSGSCASTCSGLGLTCAGIGTTNTAISNQYNYFYNASTCPTTAVAYAGDCSTSMAGCTYRTGVDWQGYPTYYYDTSTEYCFCS